MQTLEGAQPDSMHTIPLLTTLIAPSLSTQHFLKLARLFRKRKGAAGVEGANEILNALQAFDLQESFQSLDESPGQPADSQSWPFPPERPVHRATETRAHPSPS